MPPIVRGVPVVILGPAVGFLVDGGGRCREFLEIPPIDEAEARANLLDHWRAIFYVTMAAQLKAEAHACSASRP